MNSFWGIKRSTNKFSQKLISRKLLLFCCVFSIIEKCKKYVEKLLSEYNNYIWFVTRLPNLMLKIRKTLLPKIVYTDKKNKNKITMWNQYILRLAQNQKKIILFLDRPLFYYKSIKHWVLLIHFTIAFFLNFLYK